MLIYGRLDAYWYGDYLSIANSRDGDTNIHTDIVGFTESHEYLE
jgi:hypothetical protein